MRRSCCATTTTVIRAQRDQCHSSFISKFTTSSSSSSSPALLQQTSFHTSSSHSILPKSHSSYSFPIHSQCHLFSTSNTTTPSYSASKESIDDGDTIIKSFPSRKRGKSTDGGLRSHYSKLTSRILSTSQTPLGSLSPSSINEAERCISYWTSAAAATVVSGIENGYATLAENARNLLLRLIPERRAGNTSVQFDQLHHVSGDFYDNSIHQVFRCIKQHTSLHHSSPNTSLGKLKHTPTTCAVQCEEILENLEQMNIELDGGMASYPDLISHHFVMDAWAKSCHADSGAKAEDILNKLTFLSNKKRADLRPSTTTYNIVLDAHSNSDKSAHECETMYACSIRSRK
mmetsp:Transcript_31673/g.48125  ORF Transcript_31673/g.48125 Transcript_31673/m.48125 type:complete len:345 (-) Transcript_31673:295-1329(-)